MAVARVHPCRDQAIDRFTDQLRSLVAEELERGMTDELNLCLIIGDKGSGRRSLDQLLKIGGRARHTRIIGMERNP